MNGSYSAAFLNSRNLNTTFQHASEVAVLFFALGPILFLLIDFDLHLKWLNQGVNLSIYLPKLSCRRADEMW